jgi:uncharacterized protein (DUF1499 family)
MTASKSKRLGSYAVIATVLVFIFVIWSSNMFAGKQPTNLGINNGKLAACPTSPNCVSSQAAASDSEHAIAPLQLTADPAAAIASLKQIIQSMPRTKIVTETNDYLYAEFTSKLMGYVDDVEFYIDNNTKNIQVRSASRLGQSDLGVNRKRIEEIRAMLAK